MVLEHLGGGLLGGLAAGFIGAGLFGMLFGHGFMGGMGGFASILGLLLQVALVVETASRNGLREDLYIRPCFYKSSRSV